MESLEGRVAVVTGAASGIGLALARRLSARGARVVMADVEEPALRAAADALTAEGAHVLAVETDVSVPDALSELARRTLDHFGSVHVLCNNAGVFAGGLSWEAPLADYEWVFGVNTWGVVHGLRVFVPIMLEQGEEAHILNTASMAAVTAAPFSAPYYMSKHAVLTLSETLYLEMQAKGAKIGVSVLCPELVSTGIGRGERNRPEHLERKAGEGESPERDLVENAIREAVKTGLDPEVMAERAVQGILDDRFYILAEEGDPWRVACDSRLEDIRLARNPTPAVGGDGS